MLITASAMADAIAVGALGFRKRRRDFEAGGSQNFNRANLFVNLYDVGKKPIGRGLISDCTAAGKFDSHLLCGNTWQGLAKSATATGGWR
ncbi:hypothetical protein [Xaviernesmea oryzae]|uniref:hypothetical protein n=1 Tax=Xaviernesmea oryzae TaxID=464029 RepID=UPI00190EA947|nr:hypothetical protein [Xaviernesmea oryzae]